MRRKITELDIALTGLARLPKLVTLKQKKAMLKKLNKMSERDRNIALMMGLMVMRLRYAGFGSPVKR